MKTEEERPGMPGPGATEERPSAIGREAIVNCWSVRKRVLRWFRSHRSARDRYRMTREAVGTAHDVRTIWYLAAVSQVNVWVLCGVKERRSNSLVMAALCNRGPLYFCPVVSFLLSSSSFFSSPNLSGRRWDVCHTSTHGVSLVRI